MSTRNSRERWSSRWAFILVATGAAAGLGNIWKFPYVVGESGGGAFMLVYLAAIAFVALPILAAELLLGRLGNRNVIDSLRRLAVGRGYSPHWSKLGWIGLLAVFVVLSFYGVVGGWTIAYVYHAVSGALTADGSMPAEYFGALFGRIAGTPAQALGWQTAFMSITALVVGSGVRRGIERLCRWMMPLLFVLLLCLVVHAALGNGQFGAALRFLFAPEVSKLTGESVLSAVGHAFFTLSIGVGAMLTFGSYLPERVGLTAAAVTVAGLDTLVAVLAGLAIFPVVFAHGMQPASGPGLVFVSLPIAFDAMPAGQLLGTAFFLLLFVAAITSAPSMLEPMVEYVRERGSGSRWQATVLVTCAVWLLGILQVLSFGRWSELRAFGRNIFELSDFLVSNILLPLGGLLIALFAGWMLSPAQTSGKLGVAGPFLHGAWRLSLRYVAPLALLLVLVNGLR